MHARSIIWSTGKFIIALWVVAANSTAEGSECQNACTRIYTQYAAQKNTTIREQKTTKNATIKQRGKITTFKEQELNSRKTIEPSYPKEQISQDLLNCLAVCKDRREMKKMWSVRRLLFDLEETRSDNQ